jgi:hypothetical protein
VSSHSLCRCPGWSSSDESKRDSRAIGIFPDLFLSLTTLDSSDASSGQYRRLATRVLLLEQPWDEQSSAHVHAYPMIASRTNRRPGRVVMNAKPSPAVWDRRGCRRSLAVGRGWLLMAAMVASCALPASAQIHSTEVMQGSPYTQPSVSANQLLTPEKAQKATQQAREALLRGRQ